MSFKRRGCVLHQKLINLFQYKNGTDHTMDTHPNNKTFHATHLFNHWKNKTVKHIYSQRLRISYNSLYSANDVKRMHPRERRMYQKRLYNLQIDHSTDDKTKVKRKKLKVKRPTTSITPLRNILQDTPEEIINTHDLPVTIIQPIPSDDRNIPQEMSEEITNTHDLTAITIQPIPSDDRNTWHDKLGILIPNDLLPYVTEDPIYVSKRQEKLKGKHHAPGSKAWFTAIKERKRLAERKIECDNYIIETSARAKLWGNSIEYREGMVGVLGKVLGSDSCSPIPTKNRIRHAFRVA
ncbi:hypothetical protein RhiirC2_859493 [Rhizophagus irregularis]|uniref:DUF8211 domain-containing protein n=1 Tax=Rhizophagus irregularis TaxID=588596 RepID=A0A2N1P478_9GLOM|nr:hypothetical protein RhiirC2_859493 [Rhizophagus irregularis]